MKETKFNRIEWLDIAKGIGILLVIWGHCLNINGVAFQLIFTFHMPLFFVLSGYVFKDNQPFRKMLQRKMRTLLLPFLLFFLLGLIVTIFLPEWRSSLTWTGICQDLWLGDPNNVHNSSIWFLLCLLEVQILFALVDRLPMCLQILTLIVFYAFGITYSNLRFEFLGYSRMPLNLDVAPIAVVFFALGYYAKKYRFLENFNKTWKKCTVGIIGVIGLRVVYSFNGYVNLHGLNFGNPLLYLTGGVAGSLIVIEISCLLARASNEIALEGKYILCLYGRHSLIILGTQSLLIRLYIVANERFFGIELGLYHFSFWHTFICTILVAFVFCPFIWIVYERFKEACLVRWKEKKDE